MHTYYITTPIYYVNAKPHLGHAYTTIVADCLSRFHRAMSLDTYFLTGTDEHGDKIARAAEKAAESPQEYVDRISGMFRRLWPELGIENNDFIRTTDPDHIRCVQDILQKVYDKGDIYFGEYGGHYCYGCERFLTEKELDEGLCPDHQTEPELISEKNYFFRMSKYQDWLIDHIESNPEFIRPKQYKNEVLSLLKSGALEDLCISRPKSRLTWGVELPFDAEYVCYVWFDALINYVSALGYPGGDRFKKFWPAVNHLVAKDILKPHAVFWPTMLKSAEIPVYNHLNVHGYWLTKETKMSKSLGNVIDPLEMARKYSLASFRYFLLREMHFGSDANFSEEALIQRHNSDLANDLGNLFNRVLSMTHKYFGGRVPKPGAMASPPGGEIISLARNCMQNFQTLFPQCKFDRALESLWELVRGLNKYIDTMAPWTLFKEKKMERLATVMYTVLELMRKAALHLWPVMPVASEEMLGQLGLTFSPKSLKLSKEINSWGTLSPGSEVAKKSNIFPRVEDEGETHPPKKKEQKKPQPVPVQTKKDTVMVSFSDFQKMDLRIGEIVSADKHPDADRLLKLLVDVGEEGTRQIIAGLADYFAPQDLVGRQVTVLVNLEPKPLRGLESQGMVLAVKNKDRMTLLEPAEAMPKGSKIS